MSKIACGFLVLLLLGAILGAAPQRPARAQSPQQTYTLFWWTVDGGGITQPAGSGYSLGGTAGQPDAGLLSGSGYELGGGLWAGGAPAAGARYNIYLPLVARG